MSKSLIESEGFLPYDPQKKIFARQLRKNATKWENKLWYECLKGLKPRFYRQKRIDRFIVDFHCPKLMLVIEVDGSQHAMPETIEYDRARTAVLESYGLKVVRFSNQQVEFDFEKVKQLIYDMVLNVKPPFSKEEIEVDLC